jgi:hypothetical protein
VRTRRISQALRVPAFGIAVLTPILLTSAVAASPDRLPVSAPVAATPSAAPPPAAVAGRLDGPGVGMRIPPRTLAAYRKAERTMAAAAPGCGLSWHLLAGIGRIESTPTDPVAVRSVYAKATGPKKVPSATWSRFASDGDGDGKSDPHNPFDATLATARHLCSSGLNFHNHAQLLTALLRYNNSLAFAKNVLGWAAAYATGSVPINLPPIHGSVPVLPPQQRTRTRGEPQTPLVLGTSTQAVQMLPGPGPELVNSPPPWISPPPEPAPWVEPPAGVTGPAAVPTADVEVPPPVAAQWDRHRAEPTETYIEPQLTAQSPYAGDGGGRQGGRAQADNPPQPPAPSAGDNGGGGTGDSGTRRGKRGGE